MVSTLRMLQVVASFVVLISCGVIYGCAESGAVLSDSPTVEEAELDVPDGVAMIANTMALGYFTWTCDVNARFGNDHRLMNGIAAVGGSASFAIFAGADEARMLVYFDGLPGGGIVEVSVAGELLLGQSTLRTNKPAWSEGTTASSGRASGSLRGSGSYAGQTKEFEVDFACSLEGTAA